MVLSFYFTYIVNACLASKTTDYSVFKQLVDSFPIFVIAVLAGVIAHSLVKVIQGSVLLILSQILLYALAYFSLSYLVKRKELYELIDILNSFLKRK